MARKCFHKGCGKVFSDPDEPCVYHPGPPEFHEGQKGWKCCKPRVLTFDEFLAIPPCTTGKHSTVDETPPASASKPKSELDLPPSQAPKPISVVANGTTTTTTFSTASSSSTRALPMPHPSATQRSTSPAPPAFEDESDDPSNPIPANATCKRRACGASYSPSAPRDDEECTHHPGIPLFHEGSKGWTCCKRRVLEFDEFMKIEGCKKRKRHLFVGQPKSKSSDEEKVDAVRNDFYQTGTSVIVSFYLKKIDKSKATVRFGGIGSSGGEGDGGEDADQSLYLDLPTSDGKRYTATLPLWGKIEAEKCSFKIMGTKLECILAKTDGSSWPTLRSDERATGEIIQTGRPARA